MTCKICNRPDRTKIDAQLIAGTPLREIGTMFPGASKSSLQRHKEHLVINSPAVAMRPEVIASNDNLMDQLDQLQQRALSILANAEADGRDDTALRAIDRASKNIELMAKIQIVLADRLKNANGAQEPKKVVFVNLVGPDNLTCADVRRQQVRDFVQSRVKRGLSNDAATWSDEEVMDLIHMLYMPIPDVPELVSVSEHIGIYLPDNGQDREKSIEDMTDGELGQLATWGKIRPGEETVLEFSDASQNHNFATQENQTIAYNHESLPETPKNNPLGLNRVESSDKSDELMLTPQGDGMKSVLRSSPDPDPSPTDKSANQKSDAWIYDPETKTMRPPQ